MKLPVRDSNYFHHLCERFKLPLNSVFWKCSWGGVGGVSEVILSVTMTFIIGTWVGKNVNQSNLKVCV